MVSNSKKGQKKETLCANALKAEGWRIEFKAQTVRQGPFYIGHDFGDIGDVVATKGKQRRVISVKTNTHPGKVYSHCAEIEQMRDQIGLPGEVYEFWNWMSPKFKGRGKARVYVQGHWEIEVI